MFTRKNTAYDSNDYEDSDNEEESQAMTLVIKRACSVWKSGIYWQEASGVKTIIDMVDQKELLLLMQCPHGSEAQLIERRSLIISMVLHAKNEFCSKARLQEYFLHPQCIIHPLVSVKKSQLFSLPCIECSIANRHQYVINDQDKCVELVDLLYFEPYSELSTDVVNVLFDQSNFYKHVSDEFFLLIAQQLHRRFAFFTNLYCKSGSLMISALHANLPSSLDDTISKLDHIFRQKAKEKNLMICALRQLFDQISIFCGRQPPQGVYIVSINTEYYYIYYSITAVEQGVSISENQSTGITVEVGKHAFYQLVCYSMHAGLTSHN